MVLINKDKYLKDGVDVEELAHEIVQYELNEVAIMYPEKDADRIARFFEEQVKPTLTENEKVILRNIKGFELIYRNSSGILHFVTRRNTEVNHYCEGGIFRDEEIEDGECVSCINHLFQFIQPRRRI